MKHTTRWLTVLLLISLLMPTNSASAELTPPKPGIRYQLSDDGISLDLTLADFKWQQQAAGLVLVVEGADMNEEPGQPQIPVFSALVAVPPAGDVHVQQEIGKLERITPPGFMALTAPREVQEDILFSVPFPSPAACMGIFPENSIVVGEPAWLRNQRVVRVSFYPFQWDCLRQQWVKTSDLKLKSDF